MIYEKNKQKIISLLCIIILLNIIIFCKTLYDRNEQKNLILVNVENPLPEEYSVDLSEIAEGVMVAVPGCAGVWIHKTLSTR
mgnify:CR=1 FL=1